MERPFAPVTRDVLVQALEEAQLRSVVRSFDHIALPSLRLKTRRIDPDRLPLGANRVGGCPDLPRGARWPSAGGEPLSFVAQLRLADVAHFHLSRCMPRDGNIALFFDAACATTDPAAGFRVLYFDDLQTLTRRATPRALEEPMRSFAWCAVSFHEEPTLPPVSFVDPARTPAPLFAGELLTEPDERARYAALRRRLYDPAHTCHRVAGYATDAKETDLRVHAATRGGAASPEGALSEHVAEWTLLAQIDSDPEAEMTWGDGGRLTFWVRQGDLKRREFDHAWCVLEA